ncbi:MAG: alpha/beta fold hydrolase [Chloroflexota bacterium]|nr:MAG: alpha/beta fold hydrolase [Chloroflexota bacterium]
MTSRDRARRAGIAAALAVAPFAAAWRFAHVYRTRAGFPRQHPPTFDPGALGLPFELTTVPTADGLHLPAWWIPARGGQPGPAVVLVHGWESGRHRTLPNAQFLHAVGYHVLTFDVRGHGANPAEQLPVSAGEFGSDALAGVEAALARPEATAVAVLGHSMGAVGAILAAAAEPRVAAAVLTATPADPYRLTRQTFRLARLPIPDPIAYPLAWLTTRVYLKPRRHEVGEVSATTAIRRYRGPILAIHGTDDRVVPVAHLERLASACRSSRVASAAAATDAEVSAPIETLVIPGGQHSWLYEHPVYREAVARFLATALDGPLEAETAARIAVAVDARRPADDERRFAALGERTFGALEGAGIRARNDLDAAIGSATVVARTPAEVQP